MGGNPDGEIRIERFECGRVCRVSEGIERVALGKGRMQQGRVVGLVAGAKSGSECAHASIAIDLQIKNLGGERVAGLRALDEKWPGEWIVAFNHAERVPGPLERVPKAVERVGVEDVARLQMRYRFGRREQVLHVVDGGGVADDIARLPVNRLPANYGRSRERYAQQRQNTGFRPHEVCLIPLLRKHIRTLTATRTISRGMPMVQRLD